MHRILNFGDIELDAKKSPLALLAQTCSSIGKPESGSKPIIPPIEKKDVPSTSGSSSSSSDKKEGASSSSSAGKSTPERGSPSSRHNAAPGRATSRDGGPAAADKSSLRAASASPAASPNGASSSYRPYGTPKTTEDGGATAGAPKDDSVAFRTPRPSGGSHKGEKPSPTGTAPSSESSPKSDSSPSSSDAAASSSTLGTSSSSSSSSSSYPQSSSVPSTTSSSKLTDAPAGEKNAASSSPKPPGASALAGLASAQAAGYSSLYPYGPMFDPSSPAFQAALAMHGGIFNHPAYLKSASSAPHPPPSCPHPGGCTQCEPSFPAAAAAAAGFPPPPHPSLNLHHSAAAAAAAAALGLPYPFLPPGGLPPPPSALATTTASPFGSPYSSLSSQNANNSRLPFICNWVMPHDSFCGKRFATSEELLQHLRTHTSAANAAASEAAAASTSSLLNSSYPGGFSQAAAMAAAFPGGLSAHSAAAAAAAAHALSSSALSSPNSPLRRTYPTSLSPVSRYHPYKPPSSSSVPPAAAAAAAAANAPPPFPGLPHFPGLGPYYSPYANLYGPRLGAPLAPP